MSDKDYWCPKCGTEMDKGICKASSEYDIDEVYLLTCSNCCLQGTSYESYEKAYYDAKNKAEFKMKWFPDLYYPELYEDGNFGRQYIYEDDESIWIREEF